MLAIALENGDAPEHLVCVEIDSDPSDVETSGQRDLRDARIRIRRDRHVGLEGRRFSAGLAAQRRRRPHGHLQRLATHLDAHDDVSVAPEAEGQLELRVDELVKSRVEEDDALRHCRWIRVAHDADVGIDVVVVSVGTADPQREGRGVRQTRRPRKRVLDDDDPAAALRDEEKAVVLEHRQARDTREARVAKRDRAVLVVVRDDVRLVRCRLRVAGDECDSRGHVVADRNDRPPLVPHEDARRLRAGREGQRRRYEAVREAPVIRKEALGHERRR
mmetsp:Transcript_12938/g.44159  ORF Transcript_12938/g.44159 Transcript_12938/m.44159 type:complete len:275 (+) Transcript_12938:1935-2759(+)